MERLLRAALVPGPIQIVEIRVDCPKQRVAKFRNAGKCEQVDGGQFLRQGFFAKHLRDPSCEVVVAGRLLKVVRQILLMRVEEHRRLGYPCELCPQFLQGAGLDAGHDDEVELGVEDERFLGGH